MLWSAGCSRCRGTFCGSAAASTRTPTSAPRLQGAGQGRWPLPGLPEIGRPKRLLRATLGVGPRLAQCCGFLALRAVGPGAGDMPQLLAPGAAGALGGAGCRTEPRRARRAPGASFYSGRLRPAARRGAWAPERASGSLRGWGWSFVAWGRGAESCVAVSLSVTPPSNGMRAHVVCAGAWTHRQSQRPHEPLGGRLTSRTRGSIRTH